MKEIKKRDSKNILLRLAMVAGLAFAVYFIIGQQVDIGQKSEELSFLEDNIAEQEIVNGKLLDIIEAGALNNDQYAEEYARNEMDYAKKGERIFVNLD